MAKINKSKHLSKYRAWRKYITNKILYEDNVACVAQTKKGYLKSDKTKNLHPKFFSYTQELEKNKGIEVINVRSCDNTVYLFTKSFSTSIFKNMSITLECVTKRIYEMTCSRESLRVVLCLPNYGLSHWIFLERFLTRQQRC